MTSKAGKILWIMDGAICEGRGFDQNAWAMAIQEAAIKLAASQNVSALGPTMEVHARGSHGTTASDLWNTMANSDADVTILDAHGTARTAGPIDLYKFARWLGETGNLRLSCRMLVLGVCCAGLAMDAIADLVDPNTVVIATQQEAFMASNSVAKSVASHAGPGKCWKELFRSGGSLPRLDQLPAPVRGQQKPPTWPESAWVAYWAVIAARTAGISDSANWNPGLAVDTFNCHCRGVDGFSAQIP